MITTLRIKDDDTGYNKVPLIFSGNYFITQGRVTGE